MSPFVTSHPSGQAARGWWIIAGLLFFGLLFVVSATWLGQRDRASFTLKVRPALKPEERFISERLGTWLPVRPDPGARADPEHPGQDVEEARKALAASPDQAGLRARLGWLLLLTGKPAEGARELKLSLRKRPRAGIWHLLLALAQEQAGRPAAAREQLQAAESLLSSNPDVAFRLARILATQGDLRRALKFATKATQRARNWPAAERLLGRLCFKIRDYARARRAFLDLLQLEPRDQEARSALSRMGDPDYQ